MTFFKKKNTREDHTGFFSSFFFAFRLLVSIDKLLSFFQFLTILILAFIPTGILWTLKKILDLLQNHQENSWEDILPFIGLFSLLWVIQGILNQAETYFNFVFHEKITDKLIVELLKKTSTAPMSYVDNPDFQDSLHLAQQQARYKLPGLFNNVKSFLVNMISFSVLLIYFFFLLKDFAWLITLIAIPMLILKWFLANSKYQLEKSLVPMERKANYFAHILTSPEHAKEIRAFRVQDYFSDRFTGIRQLMYSRKNRLQSKIIWIGSVAEILELGVLIYVFYDLFKLSFSQSISMGVLVVYVQGIQRLQTSLKSVLESLLQLFQQRVFVRNFQQFVLLTWDEDTDKTQIPVDRGNIHSGLKVGSLDFSYPGGPKVLKNVSLNCRPGEFIAIVGLNGSGKSTLMKLLAGLYPPDSGEVLLDGVPLSALPAEEWAAKTEFVFQDFEHYHLTFKENVGLGLSSTDEQRLDDASRKAQSWEFLQKLPKKWDTQLGKWFPGGVELSGGEWQRVALTRAFYNSPKFWVLDEPSSFLDVEAEASLFKEIKAMSPDRMTVLISHRLYNLKYADRIYVLKDGEVVQDGPFEELKNIPGPFRELYKMQEI